MTSREDILQELELLPVWQLRNPAPVVTAEARPAVVETSAVLAAEKEEGTTETVQAIEPSQATHQFRLIMSDNAQWAFVLQPQHNEEAEALLQNMLKAVSVKVGQDIAVVNATHLHQQAPKMIVVMGEDVAQQLLNVEQTLEQLRGKAHQYQSIPVIATYTASHLLIHLQDKAKAWEDLCLAKFTIASL